MDKEFINKLHELLMENMQNASLNVNLLAKCLYMSRPTLYRKIKAVTDLTPNELINRARLKQAADLLESADYKVFEIAQMVGFHSQSSFGKAFIKHFKVTPTEYQLMHKMQKRENSNSPPTGFFPKGDQNKQNYHPSEHF
jgi:AraC-like DNA-binding protein